MADAAHFHWLKDGGFDGTMRLVLLAFLIAAAVGSKLKRFRKSTALGGDHIPGSSIPGTSPESVGTMPRGAFRTPLQRSVK